MQTSPENLKNLVREKYSNIAQAEPAKKSCCGCDCGSTNIIMNEQYEGIAGYSREADLQLGCGIPTQFAAIEPGNIVVDLGSGAGNDCFVARALTGESGEVIGIDFTPEMIALARQNVEKLGYTNVRFVAGDIDNIPLPRHSADVVISNCVINLVPDKAKVFSEIFRILVPGGHFCVSDVVRERDLPEAIRQAAELYAGCVSGASQISEYLKIVDQQGFKEITIRKKTPIEIPEEILQSYHEDTISSKDGVSDCGLFSITLTGYKPMEQNCASGCDCGC